MPRQVVPHLYLDTNIILDVLRDRRRHGELISLKLLEQAKRNKWYVSASTFATMEILDVEQDDLFFQLRVSEGDTVADVLRIRRQRNLTTAQLDRISKKLQDKLSISYDYIDQWHLDEKGFNHALELARTTNITATDCIHLATALELGCDVLVTADEFFLKEARKHITTSLPETVEQELRNLGFPV